MYQYIHFFRKHTQVFVKEDNVNPLNAHKRTLQEESTEGTLRIPYLKIINFS